jgi:hypothetical protein
VPLIYKILCQAIIVSLRRKLKKKKHIFALKSQKGHAFWDKLKNYAFSMDKKSISQHI